MKYLSICSGIEAATVAFKPLNWHPVAFSEIDTFPNAVLAHHYPDVPNAGDFVTIKGDTYGHIDLIIGGTPCQSFSLAGLRKGLDDERGNLALEFIRLLHRTRPKWFVWENVPGVLSSNSGRDFASLLSGFTGQNIVSQKHDRSGIIQGTNGYADYSVAWRILDAQHFGVPQRRRRVFVVGYLGDDWRPPAAVLFEQESMCRDFTPCQRKREGTSTFFETSFGKFLDNNIIGTLQAGSGYFGNGSKNLVMSNGDNVTGTICASDGEKGFVGVQVAFKGNLYVNQAFAHHPSDSRITGPINVAGTMTQRWGDGGNNCGVLVKQSYSIQGNIIGRQHHNGGNGKGYTKQLAGTITAIDRHAVAYTTVHLQNRVRKLSPTECERLQGFPDGYTQIPYRGKSAEKCPLGHRYKALGNSMAVPVLQWLGKRLAYVHEITP